MKANIQVIAFLIFFFNSWFAFSQHTQKQNKLVHLAIINKDVNTMLDSIVVLEKKCEYYSKALIFIINIRKVENSYSVIIESIKDSNIAQAINPYGYFYYQEHLMLIDGDSCPSIFSKTKVKKKFKYVKYDPNYQEKGKPLKIYAFNDDSFSQWSFWYINDKFRFESKSSSCH